jgi:hypothetical protein
VDWNKVLRKGNAWYDREVEACRQPTQPKRRAALAKIDDDIDNLVSWTQKPVAVALFLLTNPRQAMSDWTGDILVGLFFRKYVTTNYTRSEDWWMMESELNRLSFALAAYRADHGSYPAKLAELMPKYIAETPKDVFTEADLHYQREGSGYLLYSVGWNGKDDGGRNGSNSNNNQLWDDLAIRVSDDPTKCSSPSTSLYR